MDNNFIQGLLIIALVSIAIIVNKIIKNKKQNKKYNEKKNTNEIEIEDEKNKINEIELEEEKNKINDNTNIIYPYKKKYLLTKNEYYNYKKMKTICEEYGYIILIKIRLADIIEITQEINDKEYLKYFNKISSKHIDFILCDNNLCIEYLIELDDNSHNDINRKHRDNFVDEATKKAGYKLIRIKDAEQLRNLIVNKNIIL